MAQVPNIADLTINPVEVSDLREVIAQVIYQDTDFLKYHQVVEGITKKTQILLDNTSGKVGWKASGCGATASGGASIKLGQAYWETVSVRDMIDYCQQDLNQNFKPLVIKNTSDKFGDLENQEAINVFIKAALTRFIKESVERLAWLGDTDAKNVEDGGNIIDTVDPKFYTPIDGIWKQVFDAKTAGTLTAWTNIARNEQTTKANQLALTDAEAFAIVKGVYDKADDALKLDPTAYIRVTSAVYNGYKNYLAANTLSGGGLSEMTVNGIAVPTYMGVPVMTSIFESKLILSDLEVTDGGSPEVLTYDLPHRAIMATPELLPVATIAADDLNQLETYFDWKEEKSYIKFGYDIDVKVIRPNMISVAY